ncbi:MAG: branched-chain amino acid ABC transporter permease [Bacteriovoracia bacterium]
MKIKATKSELASNKKLIQNALFFVGGVTFFSLLSPVISDNMNPYLFSILMYAGINMILAASLNLVNGLTGQFSMGHAGFMSVGAYMSSYLTVTYFSAVQLGVLPEISNAVLFGIALLAGGLFSALLGVLVGLPSLRLKGDYLAIVTLGFGEIIRVLILNIDAVGGARGLPGIPKWTTFGWVYSIAFLCILILRKMISSSHGRALLAIREDEIAAEAMGVHTTFYKVFAFAVGAFFAGVAGGLFGHFLTYLNPQTFDFNRSFEVIIMVVLGGMGSCTGAVVAAVFLTVLREVLRPLQEITQLDFRMVIYSLLLIVLMLTRPSGFFGRKELSDLKIYKKISKALSQIFSKGRSIG